jgi:hypothetical protein
VTADDVGETVTCLVTANNDAGARTAGSSAVVSPENGIPSPQGEPGARLLVLISTKGKLRSRAGKRLKLPYVSTLAGEATLEVIRLKRRKRVARIRRSASEGRNNFVWSGKRGRKKPAKPGGYKLRITVTTADGQRQTDVVKLRLKKR